MIDLRIITSQPDSVKHSLARRNQANLLPSVDELLSLDELRRKQLQEVEALKNQRNIASQEIAKLKKAKADDSQLVTQMKQVSVRIKELDIGVEATLAKIDEILLGLPNVLDVSVPEGKGAEQNTVVREWGNRVKAGFSLKSHDELGEALGIFDFKKAGEVSGARFVFVKGQGASLERALIQFMLRTHIKRGYEEILPPFLVNRKALTGTGQLPKFEEDVFRIEKFDYFLIPTAEVPVTNYHRDEIIELSHLPKRYVAYTPCFRSEAGSYGKDTKGLKRQHQFNKVELVKFVLPEESDSELESLVGDAEHILQLLGLPYRIVLLCGGDTGFGSSKTYDLEVWSPVSQSYMEISSCSNYKDFQARRASIRYRDKLGKVQHLHTLNGSALAVGRTLLALLENFQKPDGTIAVPEVLKPYL